MLVKDTVPPLIALIAKNAPDDPEKVWDAILGAVEETPPTTARSSSRIGCCWQSGVHRSPASDASVAINRDGGPDAPSPTTAR